MSSFAFQPNFPDRCPRSACNTPARCFKMSIEEMPSRIFSRRSGVVAAIAAEIGDITGEHL